MVSVTDFKNGMVIKHRNDLYQIVHFQHVKMQQRAPITRTKMVNLKTGSVIEEPFRSGDRFEEVFLERKEIQYLYNEGELYHFMDTSDFQDVVIHKNILGDTILYMKDNDMATGMYCDGELLTVELPTAVVLTVTETVPGVRGDTAKAGLKPATVETGATVKVPLFINSGDRVKVDTRTGDYIERVNS